MPLLYKALGALALAASLALGGWYIVSLRADKAALEVALKTAQDTLKRTQATLASREAQRKRTDASAASARQALESVLAQNRPWADQQVPKEVQDDLCKTLRCAPGTGATGVQRDAADDHTGIAADGVLAP